jgi:hypothetical protein
MPTKYLMFKSLAIMLSNIMQLPKMNNNIYICLYLDLGRCLTESLKKKHKTMSCHILYDLIDEKTKGEKFYLILALSAITNISIALTL